MRLQKNNALKATIMLDLAKPKQTPEVHTFDSCISHSMTQWSEVYEFVLSSMTPNNNLQGKSKEHCQQLLI
jgi:hypothetical protein